MSYPLAARRKKGRSFRSMRTGIFFATCIFQSHHRHLHHRVPRTCTFFVAPSYGSTSSGGGSSPSGDNAQPTPPGCSRLRINCVLPEPVRVEQKGLDHGSASGPGPGPGKHMDGCALCNKCSCENKQHNMRTLCVRKCVCAHVCMRVRCIITSGWYGYAHCLPARSEAST